MAGLDDVEAIAGSPVADRTPMGGGCIAAVYRLTLADGRRLVAKLGEAGSGLALEGAMLAELHATDTIPVPAVLHADESLLLMEEVPTGRGLTAAGQAHAADLVAALHGVTGPAFGHSYDTVIGGLPQPNPQSERWIPFFAEWRLVDRARRAVDAGRLPKDLLGRVETLAGRLDRWLTEPAAPSLIHGDMWGGNVLGAGDRVAGFIDPAVYHADPEIELAFTTLFGTFGEPFFRRYQEHRPIPEGFFEQRRDLYNLYPLLVHVNLFGGSYVGSVERALRQFGC